MSALVACLSSFSCVRWDSGCMPNRVKVLTVSDADRVELARTLRASSTRSASETVSTFTRFGMHPLSHRTHQPLLRHATSVFGTSQPAGPEERARRLEAWKHEKPTHIRQGRAHFLGVALAGAGIRVISRDRFVAGPHLILTFHDCEAFDYYGADDADFGKVVEPVVPQ